MRSFCLVTLEVLSQLFSQECSEVMTSQAAIFSFGGFRAKLSYAENSYLRNRATMLLLSFSSDIQQGGQYFKLNTNHEIKSTRSDSLLSYDLRS